MWAAEILRIRLRCRSGAEVEVEVELNGIEPMTSGLQSQRSPS